MAGEKKRVILENVYSRGAGAIAKVRRVRLIVLDDRMP